MAGDCERRTSCGYEHGSAAHPVNRYVNAYGNSLQHMLGLEVFCPSARARFLGIPRLAETPVLVNK